MGLGVESGLPQFAMISGVESSTANFVTSLNFELPLLLNRWSDALDSPQSSLLYRAKGEDVLVWALSVVESNRWIGNSEFCRVVEIGGNRRISSFRCFRRLCRFLDWTPHNSVSYAKGKGNSMPMPMPMASLALRIVVDL